MLPYANANILYHVGALVLFLILSEKALDFVGFYDVPSTSGSTVFCEVQCKEF